MNILITGATGYLGGCIIDYLNNNYPNNNLYLATRKNDFPVNSNYTKVKIDWEDELSITNACIGIDVIVHTAGFNSKQSDIFNFEAFDFNCFITHTLLKVAIRQQVKKFIYLSTYHVYSDNLNKNYNENHSTTALNPYALSKRCGEISIEYAISQKYITGNILRISNGFGTPKNENQECWSLFINQLCKQAVQKNNIEIKSKYNIKRNFISTNILSEIICKFILNDCSESIIYNIGYSKCYTLLEVAEIIKKRYKYLYNEQISLTIDKNFIKDVKNKYFNFNINRLSKIYKIQNDSFINDIDELINFCKIKFTKSD